MSSQAAGSGSARAATDPKRPGEADGTVGGARRFTGLRALRGAWAHVGVKVAALTAAAAFVYCLDSLILFRRFLASTFDLVIFDQGIRGYAHLAAPVSIARGVSDGQGAHFLLLADHWSPILAVLAPLYWIHDGPATLLVAQGVLFALAIPPLWAYTRRQLGPGAAYFVCVAYALSLPVMSAVVFDFHEVAFVPVLTAVMVERFDAGRRWHGVLAAAAMLLVKEDMGLLVAGFGIYLMLTRRRADVWTGLAFVVGGLADTWVATHLLIPAFGGSATFYWAYGQFGPTLGSAVANVIIHPLHALRVFVTPWVKARTMIGLLATFGFLPLASPMVIAVLPLLAERMLASGISAVVAGEVPVRRVRRDDAVLRRRRRCRPAAVASPGGRPPGTPRSRGGSPPPFPAGRASPPDCAGPWAGTAGHRVGGGDLRRRARVRAVLPVRVATAPRLLPGQLADPGGRGGHRARALGGGGRGLQQHRAPAVRS